MLTYDEVIVDACVNRDVTRRAYIPRANPTRPQSCLLRASWACAGRQGRRTASVACNKTQNIVCVSIEPPFGLAERHIQLRVPLGAL